MQGVIVAVLTIAYLAVAYIGPVAAIAVSAYWAWRGWAAEGSFGGAVATFVISAFVLLVALGLAKRLLKKLMNMVDLEETEPQDRR